MSNDLSDQTESPNPYRDVLLSGGLLAVSTIPVFGPLATGAVQATLAHKQAALIAEGFDKAAARIRALEDRPTPEEMLASDEFTAACESTMQAILRTASAGKRARLAEALARMGPWGPFDEAERADLLALVERYSDLHVVLLDFFADPRKWITAQGMIDSVNDLQTGSTSAVLGKYMFPGGVDWERRVSRVCDELGRDGVADTSSSQLSALTGVNGLLSKKTTRFGDRFLQIIAEPVDK